MEKINKANEAKLHAADEKKAKSLAVVKDKVWEKTLFDIFLTGTVQKWNNDLIMHLAVSKQLYG